MPDNVTTQAEDLLNATIVSRQVINEELRILRVAPDSGQIPPFQPGQYATIGLPTLDMPKKDLAPEILEKLRARGPRMVRRAYSIASSPDEPDSVELFIVLVEDGRLTPKLFDTPEGGRVWMDDKIKGFFTLEHVPDGQDLVLISTGTGLAPYISMIRKYHGTGRWNRVVVVHGVRYARDLGYRDMLEGLAAEDENFVYIPAVTREPEDSGYAGHRGRIPTVIEGDTFERLSGKPLDPSNTHVFICGNPDMVKQVKDTLVERGFTADEKDVHGNIHEERYW